MECLKTRKWTDWLTCRQVLKIMVSTGFMFNYMLRVNMAIAIVDMIDIPDINKSHKTNTTSLNHSDVSHNLTTGNDSAPEHISHVEETRFKWTITQKNDVLGIFFWGYLVTQLPGGRMAEVIGATKILGGGMLAASIMTILTPAACYLSYHVLLVSRVFVGFFLGVTWPATLPIAAKWTPPLERSKFVANMLASSLGAALTTPVCGVLIASYGWASVFYVTGVIGLIWSILWFLIIYDSPAEHPRISPDERFEIENKISEAEDDKFTKPKLVVPWLKLLSSPAVLAIVLCDAFSTFNLFTLLNEMPTYFNEVLNFKIEGNGVFSGLPHFGRYAMAVTSSYFADVIIKSGRLSRTTTRKLFNSFAILLPGCLMIIQAFLGRNASLSVAIFTMSLFCNGAITAGYLSNSLDIAPNFAGTILCLAATLSAFGGWLSTKIVAVLTKENNTFEQWRYVFWIMVTAYMVAGSAFVLLGTGKVQKWNVEQIPKGNVQEMKPLNRDIKKENIAGMN